MIGVDGPGGMELAEEFTLGGEEDLVSEADGGMADLLISCTQISYVLPITSDGPGCLHLDFFRQWMKTDAWLSHTIL